MIHKYKKSVIFLILLEFIDVSKLFQTSSEGLILIMIVQTINKTNQ
jgi:hypothetical protein